MATTSDEHLQSLLSDVQTESAALQELITQLTPTAPGSAGGSYPPTIPAPEVRVPESYQVVVECRDEADQQTVFDKMRADGYRCRVLTL